MNVLFSISNWNNSFEILMIDRSDFLFGGIIELHRSSRLVAQMKDDMFEEEGHKGMMNSINCSSRREFTESWI